MAAWLDMGPNVATKEEHWMLERVQLACTLETRQHWRETLKTTANAEDILRIEADGHDYMDVQEQDSLYGLFP
eukprot:924157-Amphidinium_carterae.1